MPPTIWNAKQFNEALKSKYINGNMFSFVIDYKISVLVSILMHKRRKITNAEF